MVKDLLEEMEEETELPSDAGAAPKKRSFFKRILGGKKKLILIILLALVVLGGAGAGAWFFFLKPEPEPVVEEADQPAVVTEEQIQAALDKKDEEIFEDIIVLAPFDRLKLRGTSAMGRISLNLSLELIEAEDRKLFYPKEDRIRKIVESQMMELTWLELRNPEGKIKLKYDLIKRINGGFNKPIIRNIYFTNFIMQ